MSINYRILGPIVLLILIGAATAIWISREAIHTHDTLRTEEERAHEIVGAIERAHTQQRMLKEFINKVLGFDEVIHPERIERRFSELILALEHEVEAISDTGEDVKIKQALLEFERVEKDWRRESEIALGLVADDAIPTIHRVFQLEREVDRTLDGILDVARLGASQRSESARHDYKKRVFGLLITMLAIFTVFGIFFVGFGRRLAGTLSSLALAMDRICHGDFSTKAVVDHRKGEVGKIAHGIETLKTALQALTKANVQIKHLAMHDQLTGLANRRALEEHLSKLLDCDDASFSKAAIFHVDLDRFKQVNDTLGHAAGDEALIHAAKAMKQETTQSDMIARVGGDEFVIIIHDNDDRDEIAIIADNVINAISEPIKIGGEIAQIGASIGITFLETNKQDAKQLLANADMALYVSKESGRGQHSFYSEETGQQLKKKMNLLTDLPNAFQQGQIISYFQPQIDAKENVVIGFEALARWNHPKRGLLGPGEFLDLAFENGFGGRLTDIIIQSSMDALIEWRKQGYNAPCVSVNFSTKQLRDHNIAERLRNRLAKAGLLPSDIVIEILESVLLGDETDPALSIIADLKQSGFRLELDDFGTGHASISYLRKFAVDGIKLDRIFISGIERDPAQETIVRALAELCRNLNIDCLAEGVETEAEKAKLLELECPRQQGYVIAMPMPKEEVTLWLQEFQGLNELQTRARREKVGTGFS